MNSDSPAPQKTIDLKQLLTTELGEALLMTGNVQFARKAYQTVEVSNNTNLRKKLPQLLAAASKHWDKAEQLSAGRKKRKLEEISK